MSKTIWMTALLTVFFAGAASATTYDCKLRSQGRDLGWIAPNITIFIGDKSNRVLISDELIRKYSVRRVLGELVVENTKRVTLKWELVGVKDKNRNSHARIVYRATILKPSLKISVSATSSAYHGEDTSSDKKTRSARGKCVLRK